MLSHLNVENNCPRFSTRRSHFACLLPDEIFADVWYWLWSAGLVDGDSVWGQDWAGEGGAGAEGGLEGERRSPEHPGEESQWRGRLVVWVSLVLGPGTDQTVSWPTVTCHVSRVTCLYSLRPQQLQLPLDAAQCWASHGDQRTSRQHPGRVSHSCLTTLSWTRISGDVSPINLLLILANLSISVFYFLLGALCFDHLPLLQPSWNESELFNVKCSINFITL